MKRLNYNSLALYGSLGVSCLIFILVAYFGLARLSNKSSQLVNLKAQSKQLDSELSDLEFTKKQLKKYSYFNSVAATVIPNDKDQAPAVVDIYQKAKDSGFAIQNFTFPESNLGIKSLVTPGSSTSSTSPSASSGSSAISQTKPVPGIPGLYSLQLTITPQVGQGVDSSLLPNYSKFIDFLNRIENDRRTAQITNISIEPTTAGLNFTLVVNIFIKP